MYARTRIDYRIHTFRLHCTTLLERQILLSQAGTKAICSPQTRPRVLTSTFPSNLPDLRLTNSTSLLAMSSPPPKEIASLPTAEAESDYESAGWDLNRDMKFWSSVLMYLFGNSLETDTTTLGSSILDYVFENGRRYTRRGSLEKYALPNDEVCMSPSAGRGSRANGPRIDGARSARSQSSCVLDVAAWESPHGTFGG